MITWKTVVKTLHQRQSIHIVVQSMRQISIKVHAQGIKEAPTITSLANIAKPIQHQILET